MGVGVLCAPFWQNWWQRTRPGNGLFYWRRVIKPHINVLRILYQLYTHQFPLLIGTILKKYILCPVGRDHRSDCSTRKGLIKMADWRMRRLLWPARKYSSAHLCTPTSASHRTYLQISRGCHIFQRELLPFSTGVIDYAPDNVKERVDRLELFQLLCLLADADDPDLRYQSLHSGSDENEEDCSPLETACGMVSDMVSKEIWGPLVQELDKIQAVIKIQVRVSFFQCTCTCMYSVYLKPMYSFVKLIKQKSIMGFVNRVLWILKALWIVLSKTNNILKNVQKTHIGLCTNLPLVVFHCWTCRPVPLSWF